MVNDNDFSKSKIININDFIFRQNLEFYPNLSPIKCEDNVLILTINDEVKEKITLTFDLRTLPGHVWNYKPEKFMETIKFNKECLELGEVASFIKENSLNNFETNGEVI